MRELGDEERLVRDRERRVPVEHHAEKRRAGPADAEDDERLSHRPRLEDELGEAPPRRRGGRSQPQPRAPPPAPPPRPAPPPPSARRALPPPSPDCSAAD